MKPSLQRHFPAGNMSTLVLLTHTRTLLHHLHRPCLPSREYSHAFELQLSLLHLRPPLRVASHASMRISTFQRRLSLSLTHLLRSTSTAMSKNSQRMLYTVNILTLLGRQMALACALSVAVLLISLHRLSKLRSPRASPWRLALRLW